MAKAVDKVTEDFSLYEKRRLKGQYIIHRNAHELLNPFVLWPIDGDPIFWTQDAATLIEFDGYMYIHPDDVPLMKSTIVVAQISQVYEKFNCVVLSFS